MTGAPRFETEQTAAGEQRLVPGVPRLTMRERLEARMTAPMQASKPKRAADFGLFDEAARSQLVLFGTSGRETRRDALPP